MTTTSFGCPVGLNNCWLMHMLTRNIMPNQLQLQPCPIRSQSHLRKHYRIMYIMLLRRHRKGPMLRLVIQGIQCSQDPTHLPGPLTNAILDQMLGLLNSDPLVTRLMVTAVLTLGYFGFLRVSEFTTSGMNGDTDNYGCVFIYLFFFRFVVAP